MICLTAELVDGFQYQARLSTGETATFTLERISLEQDASAILRIGITTLTDEIPIVSRVFIFSPKSRKQITTLLQEVYPSSDWPTIVESIFADVANRIYRPVSAKKLNLETADEVSYVHFPLALANNAVVWYGPGSVGKSLLALAIGTAVQSDLDILGPVKKTNVLYVDWETDEHEIARRAKLIIRGLQDDVIGQPEPPLYMQARLPLRDMINHIVREVTLNEVGLVILDSAGPAAGGDILSPSDALRFFEAVRQLTSRAVAVIILTHVAKPERKADDARLPIGSIYFENYPRLTWELRSEQSDASSLAVAMYPRKSNVGKLDPIGFYISFSKESITIVRSDEPTQMLTESNATLKQMLLEILQEGPQSVKDLANTLGANTNQIRALLHRLKLKGVVQQLDGKWSLTDQVPPF